MPPFSLPSAPASLTTHLQRYYLKLNRLNEMLLYHANAKSIGIRAFGTYLEPRYIFGAESLDQ